MYFWVGYNHLNPGSERQLQNWLFELVHRLLSGKHGTTNDTFYIDYELVGEKKLAAINFTSAAENFLHVHYRWSACLYSVRNAKTFLVELFRR